MRNAKGFTMVELLVVLVIVAILAAVATPLFIQNTKRAKASEAVATIGLIRQALRDYKVNANTYFDVDYGDIQFALPPSDKVDTTDGSVKITDRGLDIDVGVAQYFSNAAFSVDAQGTSTTALTDPTGGIFSNPAPVDFLITVDGSKSIKCANTGDKDCAIKQEETKDYIMLMDNSGRIAISYKIEDDKAKTRKWSNY